MMNVSEKVADSYRTGNKPNANPANKVTRRRRKLFDTIKERTGGDPNAELDYSLKIIQRERPKIENYIMSKNEVPMDSLEDIVNQAYQLRCKEIDDTARTLGVSEGEANIFIEDDESETEQANNYEAENFIGELFAPIEIAASHLNKPEGFVDPNLISGLIGTAGAKIDSAAMKRAALDKKSGILGFLSGGKGEYEQLRKYLQDPKNKDEKDAVLAGVIKDPSQLRGFGGLQNQNTLLGGKVGVFANDVIDEIARQKKREMIRKNLPFIILGIVAIILITYLIVKNAGNKSN